MGRGGRLVLTAALAALVLVPAASSRSSAIILGPYTCTGTVGADTIVGDVIPTGPNCFLNGTKVVGNISGSGGLAAAGAKITGNIKLSSPTSYAIKNSQITGNIQISGVTGTPTLFTSNYFCGTKLVGVFQLVGSTKPGLIGAAPPGSPILLASACPTGNNMKGGLQVVGNMALITIRANTILGFLSCSGNTPAPTRGGGLTGFNTASGFTGQCASGF